MSVSRIETEIPEKLIHAPQFLSNSKAVLKVFGGDLGNHYDAMKWEQRHGHAGRDGNSWKEHRKTQYYRKKK